MSGATFRFAQQRGPHAVGLRGVEHYDYSRPYLPAIDSLGRSEQGERARPLQTLIWYPAESSNAAAMTVADYVALWATERSFGRPHMSAHARQRTAGLRRLLEQPLWAVRDASALTGRYPVVVYSPGHSNPSWENADLCEYLASHGYVVLASPSMGERTRYPTLDIPGIESQARDISFLIGFARTLANADSSEIAAIGFSWGGICNVFAAAHDDRIKALVCLDGSLRFSPGLVWKGGVRPDRMTIPLLSIAQGQWSPEERAQILAANPDHEGVDVLTAWTHGDVFLVYMLGFGHAEHTSLSQRNDDDWEGAFDFYRARKVDYSREDGFAGYAWLAEYTLQFLQTYLKRDARGSAFLRRTPHENGVPRRLMSVVHRPAGLPPATFAGFRSDLGRRGFADADELYLEYQRRDATFALDEHSLSAWSQALIDGGHDAEAIAVLKLNVRIHADSAAAAASLGDAYRRIGEPRLAAEQYRLASAREPFWVADAAAQKLRELEAR
jgi:dienelactone hydrolase